MRFFYILLLIVALFDSSCANKNPRRLLAAPAQKVDSQPGQCPYFTSDQQGRAAISWVRMMDDSSAVFCYAISKDGKNFERPIVVPGSENIQPHGENLPKIIFKPSGEIIALWGAANPNPKNKYSGLVYYAQSFNEGLNWTKPRALVSDTASYDQ